MFACPGCGYSLVFDIPSQKMHCGSCGSFFEPEEIKQTRISKLSEFQDETGEKPEDDTFETYLYTCSQCGGTIYADAQDATAFCSYCGSVHTLSSRLVEQKRPKYIIPFKVTKEDCKTAYAKHMKGAMYCPKEFKNPENIDSFRGIYMPYWSYLVAQEGNVRLPMTNPPKQKGNYLYTDHFRLEGDLDAHYHGVAYDASSTFDDQISQSLAPYHVKDVKPFKESYLAGFYADTEDVDGKTYRKRVKEETARETVNRMMQHPECKGKTVKTYNDIKGMTRIVGTDAMMYPVWFMSYREGSRVAYATVNGQTGKVTADMPLDGKKFFLGSLLFAIPIFFLLQAFLTLVPKRLITVLGALLLLCLIIYLIEWYKILGKNAEGVKLDTEAKEGGAIGSKAVRRFSLSGSVRAVLIGFGILLSVISIGGLFLSVALNPVIILGATLIFTIVGIVLTGKLRKEWKQICQRMNERELRAGNPPLPGIERGRSVPFFVLALILEVAVILLLAASPASDLWYYGGAILMLLFILWILSDMIRRYNLTTMRMPHQFRKKGGDDRA